MSGSARESAGGGRVIWRQRDGAAVSCEEKLRVLEENLDEVRQVCQDAFDDAVLMGVDEEQMRDVLLALVRALKNTVGRALTRNCQVSAWRH